MKIKIVAMLAITITSSLLILSSCCACRKGSPKVENLEQDSWKLIELTGKPVVASEGSNEVVLTFNGAEKMIYGKAPCNNFFASYSLFKEANNIEIGPIGATRMACPDMELEMQFTTALSKVVRVKIEGGKLLMLDAEGELMALLEAVPAEVQ